MCLGLVTRPFRSGNYSLEKRDRSLQVATLSWEGGRFKILWFNYDQREYWRRDVEAHVGRLRP